MLAQPLHGAEIFKKGSSNLSTHSKSAGYFVNAPRRSLQYQYATTTCSFTQEKSSTRAFDWLEYEDDIKHLMKNSRLVQWYPGHIAKAERNLKEQIKWVDVVLEVRDARIPMATTHPELDNWIGNKPKVVVLNREDMVTTADKRAWSQFYGQRKVSVISTNGQGGEGIQKLFKAAADAGKSINAKRKARGLLARPVRAAVIGFPNVGKSAIINRLLKKRVCASAPKPGVTRDLRWLKIGEDLDLLDSPGVLPSRIADQSGAARLAICNDIGEAAYAVAGIASILVEIVNRIPTAGPYVLRKRYDLDSVGLSGEVYLEALAQKMFQGDVNQAANRVLKDYRKGILGKFALERPISHKFDRD